MRFLARSWSRWGTLTSVWLPLRSRGAVTSATSPSRTDQSLSLNTIVRRRWGDVLWSLRQDPAGVIRSASRSPTGRLYLRVARFDVSRSLRLELGVLTLKQREARMPVYWEAETRPNFFPTMRGELMAVPVGEEETRLSLSGAYRPPLGIFGRVLDRLVGFRVAQLTMRWFLEDLARYLEAERLSGDQ
jgi:hypothetical protein